MSFHGPCLLEWLSTVHYYNHKLPDSQASSLFAPTTCYIHSRPSSPSHSFDISSPRLVLRSPKHRALSSSPHPFDNCFAHIPINHPRIKQRSCDLSKFTPELPNHHSTPADYIWRPRGSPHHTSQSPASSMAPPSHYSNLLSA